MRSLTYVLLNIAFMLAAYVGYRRLSQPQALSQLQQRALLLTAIGTYLLMVIFNTYLTSLPIVQYDPALITGIKVVSWPIEDLAYLVVALYLAPAFYVYWLKVYETKQANPTSRSSQPADPRRRRRQPTR